MGSEVILEALSSQLCALQDALSPVGGWLASLMSGRMDWCIDEGTLLEARIHL